jgi:hypothetical protein
MAGEGGQVDSEEYDYDPSNLTVDPLLAQGSARFRNNK